MIRKAFIVAIVACASFAMHGAQAATAKLHKAVGTAVSVNGVVTAVPSGTSVIDTQTIKCADTNGCVILAASMVQVISNGSAGQWQIGVYIDGNLITPGSPVQGIVPTSNYVVGNLRAAASVATGTHSVQTQLVMPSAGNIAAREFDYTVLKN
jgi:hypothetical protein